jgi:hypothetical protein
MILSILPRNDDELREFEEFLKSENMVSPLSSKDMELNITAQRADEATQRADENRAKADEATFKVIKMAIKYNDLEGAMMEGDVKLMDLATYLRNEVEKLKAQGMDPDYQDIILSDVAIEKLNVYLGTQEETDEVQELMAVIETYSKASKQTQGKPKKPMIDADRTISQQ